VELKAAKVPPPLRNAILQQPYVLHGTTALYACGCTVKPQDPRDLGATWRLCDRHTSTMHMSGRMLQ
jgi:hypothetical protein